MLSCDAPPPAPPTAAGLSVVPGPLVVYVFTSNDAPRPPPRPSDSCEPATGVVLTEMHGKGVQRMGMQRHFIREQRVRLLAPCFARDKRRQAWARALADRHHCLQVRQGEVGRSVAAVLRSQNGEQRGVLGDRQNLTVTECPPNRCEVEAEEPKFANEWVHRGCSCQSLSGGAIGECCRAGSVLAREDTEQRDDVGQREVRLAIVVRIGSARGGHSLGRQGDRVRGAVIYRLAGRGTRRAQRRGRCCRVPSRGGPAERV